MGGETVLARFDGGSVEPVPAWPTPVPGLVIAAPLHDSDPEWTLHHVRSGCGVFAVTEAGGCEVLAAACLDLAGIDWTRSGADLKADAAVTAAVDRVRERWGLRSPSGRRSDGADLAPTPPSPTLGGRDR